MLIHIAIGKITVQTLLHSDLNLKYKLVKVAELISDDAFSNLTKELSYFEPLI
jgi:hypothetical protein